MTDRIGTIQTSDVDGDEPAGGAVGRGPMDGNGGLVLLAYAHNGLALAAPARAPEE